MADAAPPIDRRVLEEAADWLMQLEQLDAGPASDELRAACERWRARSSEHARAWARAELLMRRLGGLPASLAMPALDRQPARAARRAAVAKLAALLAVGPAAWTAWCVADARGWTAEHRTATGERRDLTLADGTQLSLNTATALDLRFDHRQRLLRLHGGEVLIRTAHEDAPVQRPFRVETAQGSLQALGTRFSVRQDDARTQVAVFEGAVRVEPLHAGGMTPVVLRAGHRLSMTADAVSGESAVDDTAIAWTQGMLLADRMRLADFARELSRYREGVVRCEAAVAELRISGAFPVSHTDRVLAMLASTYAITASTRLWGRWVTLDRRASARKG